VSGPVAVLMVADYYGDLLRPGPCRSRAACVYRAASGAWVDVEPLAGWTACALPLWWDGALVPEGWDRARRVARAAGVTTFWPDEEPSLRSVVRQGELLIEGNLASRVVLLDRVDGRLVERAP